jgi:hypothetical protein
LVGFDSFGLFSQPQQSAEAAQSVNTSGAMAPAISIPDGTPVEMRFAQAVRGKMLNPVDVGVEAKQGETVRLVAAGNVWVAKKVVIAEGAVAQATVTQVKRPLSTLVATGLGLQLDWIEDVTGTHIPLRILQKGGPEPFMVQVVSTPGGAVARPETLHGDILGRNALDVSQIWRDRYYIPAGTRLMAYVQGAQVLDPAKVEGAQSQVTYSEFSTTADVVIYRTKGHGRDRVRVRCDENFGRAIGEREYIRLDLPAGKHRCRIENHSPQELAVEPGQEYFFQLRRSGVGWELKSVTVGEGEDSIENADPAPKQ